MDLTWGALALMCIVALLAWFWQDSLAAREAANSAALEACRQLGLQLLDGTVAFARLSLAREHGRARLRRTYIFDYTANSIERREGFVVLTGRRVDTVGYARDEVMRAQHVRPAPSAAETAAVVHRPDQLPHRSEANAPGASAPSGRPTLDEASEP